MNQRVITDPGGTDFVRVLRDACLVNGSLLIVPADTVAVFVCNGIVSEPYGPGRHEIYTGISPFFIRFRNLMTAGDPGVICQVFYINMRYENVRKGGTGDLLLRGKRISITIVARASYTLRYVITNPTLFISRLVGMHNLSYDEEGIMTAINSMILPSIKESIISVLSNEEVYSYQNRLTEMGDRVRVSLHDELLSAYGIELRAIAITAVNVDEESVKKLKELEENYARSDAEAYNIRTVWGNVNNRTLAEATTGGIRGPVTEVVSNEGMARMPGTAAGLFMGMSLGSMAANQMGESMRGMFNTANENTHSNEQTANVAESTRRPDDDTHIPPPLPRSNRVCPNCHRRIDGGDVFCKHCGNRL